MRLFILILAITLHGACAETSTYEVKGYRIVSFDGEICHDDQLVQNIEDVDYENDNFQCDQSAVTIVKYYVSQDERYFVKVNGMCHFCDLDEQLRSRGYKPLDGPLPPCEQPEVEVATNYLESR